MFVEIDKKVQINLIQAAIKKANSEKKLEKITKIPASSIYSYKKAIRRLPYKRFKQILSFLNVEESVFNFRLLDPKMFKVKGGNAVYQKYLKEKRFDETPGFLCQRMPV